MSAQGVNGLAAEERLNFNDLCAKVAILTSNIKVLKTKANENKTRLKVLDAKFKETMAIFKFQQQKAVEDIQKKNKEIKH
ncbi:hypothetical protein HG530_002049 [Fusarium avenaceum]|nr:hypothetical protein HG530_002049 [Fusarium avenaceum]